MESLCEALRVQVRSGKDTVGGRVAPVEDYRRDNGNT